jgi:hypothetical protein
MSTFEEPGLNQYHHVSIRRNSSAFRARGIAMIVLMTIRLRGGRNDPLTARTLRSSLWVGEAC